MTNPSIYQINTRIILQERGVALRRAATLDDLEDRFLDDIAAKGFQWVWFLGVWQTGAAGRAISRYAVGGCVDSSNGSIESAPPGLTRLRNAARR